MADNAVDQAGAAAAPRDISGLPLLGGPQFPIGIFWPPPPDQTTATRYQQIADAGFTFVISGNYMDDGNIIQYALQQCANHGLKMLISDDTQIRNLTRWFTISDDRSVPMSITTADGRVLVQRALDAYAGYPSFAGFNLFDEPWRDIFPSLGRAYQIVRGMTPNSLSYSNLPDSEWTTPADWANFVEQYITTVQPTLLSFDRYPIRPAGVDTGYFSDWVTFRRLGQKYGLPTWIFIQSVSNDLYRATNKAELLWQINVSLAYGAKGIQYFTYWTPDPARGEGFGPALVALDGTLTSRYQAAKQINTQWLAQVGRQLKPLVSETVVHFGDPAPVAGITAFTPDDIVGSVAGDPVIIGRFRDGSGSPTRWLFVANRLTDAPANTTLGMTSQHVVTKFDPRTQTYRATSSTSQISVSLQAGEAALFEVNPHS
ncbi:hypothetical protein [Kutzneria sp. NPDC052558]|uniref:hypothetical protein n=1 Tax=Kutzneria sp. NPDC052558 TaxID=3364121 RepID=UPI0037CA3686